MQSSRICQFGTERPLFHRRGLFEELFGFKYQDITNENTDAIKIAIDGERETPMIEVMVKLNDLLKAAKVEVKANWTEIEEKKESGE